MSMTKARFARGFTLVEVLVVVLLVAITVSFAVVKLAPDDRETVLGEAARLVREELVQESARIQSLRDALHHRLETAIPGLVLNGHAGERLPNTLNLSSRYADYRKEKIKSNKMIGRDSFKERTEK